MKHVVLASLLATAFAANATDFKTAPPVHVFSPAVSSNSGAVSGSKSSASATQEQVQRQSQRNNQSQRASSVSTSAGGNANGGGGGAGGASSADTVNSGNNTTINTPRPPANSAANVAIMPTAYCAGSTGAGAQNSFFGVSFGTSWTDENCMRLERVRNVAVVLQDQAVAEEVMCNDKEYYEARERLGRPCITRGVTQSAGGATHLTGWEDVYKY